MRVHPVVTPVLFVAALSAWGTCAAEDAWVGEARGVATALPPKLLTVLRTEIEQHGVTQAVGVCNEKAPQMGKAASAESGWQVRRVSLRPRNPKAVPDAWEAAALADFDRRAAAGEDPTRLERAEIVTSDGQAQYRYLKALPVQQMCLGCHGPTEPMPADLKARLGELYPNDQATGYALGQIRGAVTLKKPAP